MQRLPIDTDLFSDQGVSYTVVNSLARPGGTAEAYLVICTSGPAKGIPFAVKLFVSGIEARRQAFTKELEFLRANQHEAILPVYDFGSTVVGDPFYVSRLMSKTLANAISDNAATYLERLIFANQICSALSFLSSNQIVHRDVKPRNIFVNGKTCVLGDFGMLQRFDDANVEPGCALDYRTPELVGQLKHGGAVNPKSDVFQLGLVFFELFAGQNPLEKCKTKTDDITLEDLSEIHIFGDLLLKSIIVAMLEHDPKNRPTPDDLLDSFIGLTKREISKQKAFRS